MQIGKRIRKARLEAGLTQAELAKKAGVGQGTLSLYESGKVRPTAEALGKIARALGKPVSYFYNGREERDVLNDMAQTVNRLAQEFRWLRERFEQVVREQQMDLLVSQRIPLLGSVPCSNWSMVSTDVKDYVDVPRLVRGCDFALIARGESMSPTILDGDILFVKSAREPIHNAIVVTLNEHNEVTLKRALYRGGYWQLSADNPEYSVDDVQEVKVIGIVIGLMRRFQ